MQLVHGGAEASLKPDLRLQSHTHSVFGDMLYFQGLRTPWSNFSRILFVNLHSAQAEQFKCVLKSTYL